MNSMVLILSYPRSGNTWVRYIIEALSGRQTLEKIEHYTQKYWLHYNESVIKRVTDFRKLINIDESAPPIACKSHNYVEHPNINKLLLLLRNPSYACISNNLRIKDANYIHRYIKLIHCYHNFTLKKHVVYYEDLLHNPQENLLKICDLMECGHHNIPAFMTNYKKHFDHCVNFYSSINGSFTNGINDNFYNQHRIQANNIINCIKNKHDSILNAYLGRYLGF